MYAKWTNAVNEWIIFQDFNVHKWLITHNMMNWPVKTMKHMMTWHILCILFPHFIAWHPTSSWLLSTFGLLAVLLRLLLRLMLTVASDLERWWVRLEGDRLCSPLPDAAGQKGLRVRGSRRARAPAGLSSSDNISFLSLVPRECRCVEMCMSDE